MKQTKKNGVKRTCCLRSAPMPEKRNCTFFETDCMCRKTPIAQKVFFDHSRAREDDFGLREAFSAEHVNLLSPPLVARSVRRNANKLDCASRPLQPALAARFPPSVPPSHKVTHDGYPGCRDVRQGDAGAHRPARAEAGHALSGIVLSRVAFPRNAVQKALRVGPASAWRAKEPAHAAPDGP